MLLVNSEDFKIGFSPWFNMDSYLVNGGFSYIIRLKNIKYKV